MTLHRLALLLAACLAPACSADGCASSDDSTDARGGALGCFRLDDAPGWAYGAAGDVLCMQRERFVVLLADGTWDGWPVRWEKQGDVQRATALGGAKVEGLGIHWDVRPDPAGSLSLERPSGARVRLSPLPADAKATVQARLAKVGDVMADCHRVRRCWDQAPAVVRDIADPDALYGARACAAMALSACRGQP